MHRRSYYPHNQQIVTQMTATSSTGFVSSRPETPNAVVGEYAEGTGSNVPPVAVREVSLEGKDSLERGAIRRTDEYAAGYGIDMMPMNNVTNEKDQS